MDERILEFIGDLRRAEVRISPSEALDALAASAEVGLLDREIFKAALSSSLIKESRDLPTFDRLFDLYFLDLQALGEGLKKALGPEDPGIRARLERLIAEEGIELHFGGRFHRGRLLETIYLNLHGVGSAVDVVLVTPEEVERYRECPYLVIAPAVKDGKVVYAA